MWPLVHLGRNNSTWDSGKYRLQSRNGRIAPSWTNSGILERAHRAGAPTVTRSTALGHVYYEGECRQLGVSGADTCSPASRAPTFLPICQCILSVNAVSLGCQQAHEWTAVHLYGKQVFSDTSAGRRCQQWPSCLLTSSSGTCKIFRGTRDLGP